MKSSFKELTFIFALIIVSQNLFAAIISQESLKTHLRWNIKAQKEQIKINKKGNRISLQSLDPDFFQSFSAEVSKLNDSPGYLKKLKFTEPSVPGTPYKLDIDLKDNSIELFTFYKQETKQYILDFWINQDVVATKKASIKKKTRKVKVAKLNKSKKLKVKKIKKENASLALRPNKKSRFNVIDPSQYKESDIKKSKFRDFRYGASFVWDYKALIPSLERDIDISVKAPDYLYPVEDLKNIDPKNETHMQLSINFYKKKQWGLMTRSIGLYEEKYGHDNNKVLNNYMKALAMMKNSIKANLKPEYKSSINEDGDIVPGKDHSKAGIMAAARSLLKSVVEESRNYELSQAVLRYLIQYSRNEKDYIQTLEFSKKLYVKSSEAFDNDMIIYSSRAILNSLANLRQLNKIKDFLSNKVVLRVLPKQVGLAYIGFVNLENDNSTQVVADFVSKKNKLSNPIHPSILFNTAEAYFRLGQYKKSIKTFDRFITNNSFLNKSSNARLRIALSYDLLGRDYKTVLKLYDDAINKSSDMSVRYEAKLRYVGLRVNRNKKPTDKDFETISFLDAARAEKNALSAKHKKLLWLVRLRSLISQSKYDDALAYLSTLPLDSIRLIDKRAFNGDGAEIVLGMIQNAYLMNDYAKAVKVWEVYKNKYENKVANNPYMNFIVTDSFLKLGLSKSYNRSLEYLVKIKEKTVRRFPLWVTPHKNISVKDYIVELKLNKYLRDNDFKGLSAYLEKNKSNRNINYKFYNGIVDYKLSKYTSAVKSFEELLITPNLNNILTPNQNLKMIETYLEALYETAKPSKFRQNASALVNDLRVSKNNQYKKLVERADYLYLESLFSETETNYKLLSRKAGEFVNENKKSNYISRIEYLKGVALVNTNQQEEGKKVLNNLLSREGIPAYLKSLVRSELSTLEFKNKTL
jgi:hypothetical protein